MIESEATVKTMTAAYYKGPKEMEVKEVPYPSPGPGEVTIKVNCCGICGTDLHIYQGDFISPYPLVGGHEFSGTIHQIGKGLDSWKEGERVSVDPSLFCGECYHCRNNQFNHCENWNALGNTVDGAFAQFVKVPAKNVYRLSEGMSDEQGALIEPLSCVAYALNRIQPKFSEKAIIFGAGPMGLMLLQALKTSGTSQVVVVDIADEKLELARSFGATGAYYNDKNLEKYLRANHSQHGFDIVVDATGIPKVIEGIFQFAGPRARILQFGVAPNQSSIQVNPFDIYHKDWNYMGSMALAFNFYQAYEMIEQRKVNVQSLVTRKLNLNEFVEYMKKSKSAADCKALVYPNS